MGDEAVSEADKGVLYTHREDGRLPGMVCTHVLRSNNCYSSSTTMLDADRKSNKFDVAPSNMFLSLNRTNTYRASQTSQETALLPLDGRGQGKCLNGRALTTKPGDTKKNSPFILKRQSILLNTCIFLVVISFFVPGTFFFRVQIYIIQQ